MNHEILYDQSFALAVVTLEQGERIMAESGAMVSMSPTIQIQCQAQRPGPPVGMAKKRREGRKAVRSLLWCRRPRPPGAQAPTDIVHCWERGGRRDRHEGREWKLNPGAEPAET